MLYLARRRGVGGFSRLVALKLVHSHLVEDETINRLFLDEARISATVAHPNVVNVEEVGQAGGNYFIAMEYVHGVSLAELLESLAKRRLRMSPKLCAWLGAQVAEALHAVHEATGENGAPLHIVHRDVSPQNVLIAHTGHIKLIDFGIANSQVTNTHASASGRVVLGKLGYMAPEQLRLEPADRRSDVYALGVMLWEMLTSRNLFRCRRVDDERDWATRESPPAPSKYSQIASPLLDRAVLKAIAYERDERHESALEFRAALLRADPSAAQVDAPMFAALMQNVLGEELRRRRANLPSEVSEQLELDTDTHTSPALSLHELTADMGSPDETFAPEPDEEEPTTVADSPPARRRQPSNGYLPRIGAGPWQEHPSDSPAEGFAARPSAPPQLPNEARARERNDNELPELNDAARVEDALVPAAEGGRFMSVEARIATIPAPAVRIDLVTARGRFARMVSLGSVCLALGIVLGSFVSGSEPSPMPAHAIEPPTWIVEPLPPSAAPERRTLTTRADLTVRSVADGGGDLSTALNDEPSGLVSEERAARAQRAALRREAKRASVRRSSTRTGKLAKATAASGTRKTRKSRTH